MQHKTQVLVIGAGPIGQGLAIELGQRGIQCLIVEKNPRIGVAPRAKTTNLRTRTHMRRWGIAGALKAASPFGAAYPSNIVFTTRLGGHLIDRFENALYCAPGRHPHYPEHSQWIPQYTVEQVMRSHLDTLPGVQVHLNHELVGFTQSTSGVTATVRNLETGQEHAVQADYLVGCDGSRSRVREAIGAKMEGNFGLSRNYNIVFKAPGMMAAHGHGPGIMYWQINADAPSILGPMDSDDRWYFMPLGLGKDVVVTVDNAGDYIRRATGLTLPFEVLSVDEWVAHSVVADKYRDGRVFLAGDACHLHPPFGGFGMNMGVSDAVDLGWKIAATLQGWGGSALLDSYVQERRPVHINVLKEASYNHSKLSSSLVVPGIEDDGAAGDAARAEVSQLIQASKLAEFYALGTILGDRYSESVVVQKSDAPSPPRDFLNYVPNALPGSIAPHLWLHDGSSLYDQFGNGLTLLAHQGADATQLAAAQKDAQRLHIPFQIAQPDNPALPSLYPHALTLVRPDQHIAWSGDAWPAAPAPNVLAMATGQLSPTT